jgi:hypothetical protein
MLALVTVFCGFPEPLKFQLLKLLTDFHETWYEHFPVGGHVNVEFINFLKLVTSPLLTHELVKWKQS